MPRDYSRQLRVAAELQRILNELLLTEIKDPRLEGVSVTNVDLSGDLGVAKVYYASLQPDEDHRPVDEAFAKAKGFLRARVGRALRLRRVPELRFALDTSAREGIALTRLIDELDDTPTDPASD